MSEVPDDPEDSLRQDATRRFYRLIWPHLATVLRIAVILCGGNATEAEDLAQEAMLKAFAGIARFQEGTDARAWLLAILRNTRIDRVRAGKVSAGNISLEALETEPGENPVNASARPAWDKPEDVLEAFSDARVISALRQLPEEIRWTLLLIDVEGLAYQDAAGVLGVPVGTIRSRAHRGRAMLREALLPVARDRRIVRD